MIDYNITENFFRKYRRMIDCRVTENFLHEYQRMCKSYNIVCSEYIKKFPEEAIAVVQVWSDTHPSKTFLSDFLEKHPKAQINDDGSPYTCLHTLGYCENDGCHGTCKDCWNRPLTEENQND